MRCLLIFAAFLTFWSTRVSAETPIDLAPCMEMLSVMPADLAVYDAKSCAATPTAQSRAELVLEIPAEAVIPLAERLKTDFGMGEMVFVCCGYEPAGAQVGEIPIPDSTIAPGPSGTRPALQVRMFAAAFGEYFADADRPPDLEFGPLGKYPASLILTLMDI